MKNYNSSYLIYNDFHNTFFKLCMFNLSDFICLTREYFPKFVLQHLMLLSQYHHIKTASQNKCGVQVASLIICN